MSFRPTHRLALAVWISVFGPGCVLVKPWERGELADRRMQVSIRPLHDGCHSHFLTPREGTRPTQDGGGGGCGCD
ncbi:MAG: DUF4266 domain-containing protein [Deltaproteobacteria bacterium]|nr:DUF4266 domain-containing protein [Deltaproteobacteria bacterium]